MFDLPARLTTSAIALVCAAGCGDDRGTPLPPAPIVDAQAVATARVTATVDPPEQLSTQSWDRPKLRRRSDGTYVMSLGAVSAESTPDAELQLTGLGLAGHGSSDGRRWTGPGVDLPWTTSTHGTYTATVTVSGQRVGLTVWSTGGQWRAIVDGKAVTPSPLPAGAGGAFHTLSLHFPDRRSRTIRFELSNGAWIAGLTTATGDSPSLPDPLPKRRNRPSVYWLGDSYSRGTGATHPGFDDLVHVVTRRLALTNVTIDALTGTGYVKTNAARGYPNFPTRAWQTLGRHRVHPAVVVVAGSINDAYMTAQQEQDAASRTFASIRRGSPDARIVVIPFTTSFPVPRWLKGPQQGIEQAARRAGAIYFDLPAAVQRAGGNLAALQGSDGHPTAAGHALYGRLIADFLAKRIPALAGR